MEAAPVPILLLIPTPRERAALTGRPLPGAKPSGEARLRVETIGFGPVAAAARTAALLERHRPRQVVLAGIAGGRAGCLQPPHAALFDQVLLDGVGAGEGDGFLPASRLGFPLWQEEDASATIRERLPLAVPRGLAPAGALLTVCAASASPAQAARRWAEWPDAVAEDMEAFGCALAARLAGRPLTVVRGISNTAGERDRRAWRIDESLAAARTLLAEVLQSLLHDAAAGDAAPGDPAQEPAGRPP